MQTQGARQGSLGFFGRKPIIEVSDKQLSTVTEIRRLLVLTDLARPRAKKVLSRTLCRRAANCELGEGSSTEINSVVVNTHSHWLNDRVFAC